ncbi:MAG: chemotaxis protein CheA [candidate division Zixibacteria bacterium]|nr:chemotaxis protein CheA [candidate division Zixibacteria bacterium]
MNKVEKIIEQIAVDVVMVSYDDPADLAALHDRFLQFTEMVDDRKCKAFLVALATADLIEKIILKDVPDSEASMNTLNEAVISLQYIIRDKRDDASVSVPKGLGLIGEEDCMQDDSIIEAESAIDDLGNEAASTVFEEKEEKIEQSPEIKQEESAEKELEISDEDRSMFMLEIVNSEPSLLPEFITEAREHCTSSEQNMMDLETGEDFENSINAIFRGFHSIKGAAGFLDLKPIGLLAHELETLLDLGRKGTVKISGIIADTVFDSIDAMRTLLDSLEKVLESNTSMNVEETISSLIVKLRRIIANKGEVEEEEVEKSPAGEEEVVVEEDTSNQYTPKRLGEILVEAGEVLETDLQDELAAQKEKEYAEKIGQSLVKKGVVPAKTTAQALRSQTQNQKEKTATTGAVKGIVKIDTERLDRLIDTIGELVIAESMVGQDEQILAIDSPHIARNISHLNKITRELQEMGMAMRLVPVKPTFQKLSRAVRDLTKKSGKQIDLELVGEDTEVDRSIVENIGDPLMHMVRNSVDHGIESPSDRLSKGKPEKGHLKINAYHKGGNLYFDITDDGAGLNRDRILNKAKERGLVDPHKELTDREISNLIFLPGFSTAKKVTSISGRGVGMDVVKRNIEAMRGYIEVESNENKGTKFSMRLPLTLSIIDGMMVNVENEKFIIPTLSVVESLALSKDIINTVNNRAEVINLRGELLPLFRIDSLFGIERTRRDYYDGTIVVVEDVETRVGLVVDELLGQRQTVIKSLGKMFNKQKWISGGAILSNGNVGLIIDVSGIIKLAHKIGSTSYQATHQEENDIYQENEPENKDGEGITAGLTEEIDIENMQTDKVEANTEQSIGELQEEVPTV